MGSFFYSTKTSAFGAFSIVWRRDSQDPAVHRIFLPNERISMDKLARANFSNIRPLSHPRITELGEKIQAFLSGKTVEFGLELMAFENCSRFQERVLMAEYRIPRGWVSTYGAIGKHLGLENGARAVGGALARNPFPIVIPCHRAIRSNGELGGYQGGLKMKRMLLEFEGITVSKRGKVLAAGRYYEP